MAIYSETLLFLNNKEINSTDTNSKKKKRTEKKTSELCLSSPTFRLLGEGEARDDKQQQETETQGVGRGI